MEGEDRDIIIFPDLFEGEAVIAFFTGKKPGTDPVKIAKIAGFNRESIYIPIQQHTSEITIIDSDLTPRVADAVITDREGLVIGIHVADCVPILLYERRGKVIGAVHAGWRGTAAGILMKTIEAMGKRFSSDPSDILIAMGPSIRWCCYGVGYEVIDAVQKATGDGGYILRRDDKYCLDLPSANKYQALKMGILPENIWVSEVCTFCEHESFYSYRFLKDAGRQGGFIAKI